MSSAQPLSGVLVVSIEQAVAAPTCTVRLADAGARVVKIERAEGETARHYDRAVHGTSAYFAWLNRGKQSAVLNLKDTDDLALTKRMIAKADVFVQNLAPGAAVRLGLGPDDLRSLNERLISLAIVGYGEDTPYAKMRAYDLLVQAESGVCHVTGTPEEACKVGVSVADIATGMNAHAAILEALIERSVTGKGRHIEMAMFDTLADWMNVPLLHFDYEDRETQRFGLGHASVYPYRPYSCVDGEVVIVVQNPGEWRRLCEMVLEKPDLVDDPRFHDNPARLKNRVALDEEISDVIRNLHRSDAINRLEGADLAWANLSTVGDLSRHPALRRLSCEVEGGAFSLAAPALHPNLETRRVPELGADTDRIREEFSE
ncbi:MAG: CaiB/BaiF CoA-transferase family protein [Pseudomonadota bacterium]